jgi:cytochrome c oxidase cbb3-type subunit 4
MDTATYDAMRHFADSWGLVYMFGIFLFVLVFMFRRGARSSARDAANIPLRDDTPAERPGS